MRFLQLLEQMVGKRSERHRQSAAAGPGISRTELSFMGRLTRLLTRDPVELVQGGKKIEILLHSDIDPKTGKAYPDYKKRREARKAEESAPQSLAVYHGDIDPD